MKASIICPTAHLELSELGDFYFVLAQRVLDDEKYRKFYQTKHDKHMMLDNGAFELTKSMSLDDLIDAVMKIEPDEVVAPDYPMHGKESYEMTKEFCSVAPHSLKIVALPHGRDVAEYVLYYDKISKLDRVSVIGFSVLFHKNYKGLRPHVVNFLIKKRMFDTTKEHHLFGLDDLAELWLYSSSYIRSLDCSLPISLAANNLSLSICDFPEKHTRVNEKAVLDDLQLWDAKQYIKRLLSVAHEV